MHRVEGDGVNRVDVRAVSVALEGEVLALQAREVTQMGGRHLLYLAQPLLHYSRIRRIDREVGQQQPIWLQPGGYLLNELRLLLAREMDD